MAFVPFVSTLTFCLVRQCALSAPVGGGPLLAFITLSLGAFVSHPFDSQRVNAVHF